MLITQMIEKLKITKMSMMILLMIMVSEPQLTGQRQLLLNKNFTIISEDTAMKLQMEMLQMIEKFKITKMSMMI